MKNLMKTIIWVVVLATFLAGGISIVQLYVTRHSLQVQLEKERKEFEAIIDRLTDRTRRAQLVVDSQVINGSNKVVSTTLLWQEYTVGPGGEQEPMPIQKFTIPGDTPHIDALVLKFQDNYVEEGDLLRGKTLAFFRRIYGESQPPDEGASLLGPGNVPMVLVNKYGQPPNQFVTDLWNHVWDLIDNQKLAQSEGLDVVQGTDVYKPVAPGKLYTIYVPSDGSGLDFVEEIGESDLVQDMLKQASEAESQAAPSP
ncbi:MAG TPA: hypothetical protein VKJ65_12125 [Phycisphaerae bacterium]|nr:hypothetical protein [Phycisphaerae bacterium]